MRLFAMNIRNLDEGSRDIFATNTASNLVDCIVKYSLLIKLTIVTERYNKDT